MERYLSHFIFFLCFGWAFGQGGNIFYPYGSDAEDETLHKNDDGFSDPINVSVGIPFFNKTFRSLFVNTNGGISFNSGVSSYTPEPFPIENDIYFIAAFWADVDTTINNGSIFYREVIDITLLDKISADVVATYGSRGLYFFKATWGFVATWDNVTYYGGNAYTEVNSFQLTLVTDGTYAFTIFNYGEIRWTYGTASDGVDAQVGFNAGDGVNYFAVPASRTPGIVDIDETTNVGIPGRWMFRIDLTNIEGDKCSTGETSACGPNEEPTERGCEVIAPSLEECPKLIGPEVENQDYVFFYCDLTHNYSDHFAGFEVTFLFNGEIVEGVEPVTTTSQRVALHERYLQGQLDKWLSCSVVTYFASTPHKKSAAYSSQSYFMGIVPSSYDIVVSEGDDEPVKVYLQSTLPMTCSENNAIDAPCYTAFPIYSTGNLLVYQKGQEGEEEYTCRYRINKEDWKEEERVAYNLDYQLEIITVTGPLLNKPTVNTITFPEYNSFPKRDEIGEYYDQIWTGYKPPSLTVYTYDGVGATCISSGDPRVTTFDGVNYNAYATGQFVLAKSSSVRNFEVHVRHKACARSVVACVCAVAVREGNDTLILDMCTSELKTLYRTASPNYQLAEGAKITNNGGNSYTMRTPSGAFVNVDKFSWGLNVYLKVLKRDFGKMEGLCGTFDNDMSNDFKIKDTNTFIDKGDPQELNRFVDSWRLPKGESYIYKQPEAVIIPNPARCKCKDEGSLCQRDQTNKNEFIPMWSTKVDVVADLLLSPQQRKKRSITSQTLPDNVNYDYDPTDFDYAESSTNDVNFDWPTASGITETQAWDYCNTTLVESVAYRSCTNNSVDVKLAQVISKCAEDIKVTDNFDWANDKIGELLSNCLDSIAQSNSTAAENETSNEISEQVVHLLEDIVSDICPGQCDGRGMCLNSQCLCDEGFEGADCTIDASSLPTIVSFRNFGLCDITERPCTSMSIRAQNLVNTDALLCQISVNDTGHVYYFNATYQGLDTLICPLPQPQPLIEASNLLTYDVRITKNGVDYGPSKPMQLYDGNCIECSSVYNCQILESRCSIMGVCYESLEKHPNHSCYVCNPLENQMQWTISDENQAPIYNGSTEFVKVMSEQIIIDLVAYDPEGDSVTFQMNYDKVGDDNVQLLQNGTFIWGANVTTTVSVGIMDVCGTNIMFDINLRIIDCPCSGNAMCALNSNGSGIYDCNCPPGFTGDGCLSNIDDCVGVNCTNGDCVDDINMYVCNCSEGFTGMHCEMEVQECNSSPCLFGICEEQIASYNCLCNLGYTGTNCEIDIDECLANPCINGICTDNVAQYTCTCAEGYTGIDCDIDIDECASSPCQNGICQNLPTQYQCICGQDFTGQQCEVDQRYAVWLEWSEYTACSKSCDYGIQKRTRGCKLNGTCSGSIEETQLCNTHNCQKIPEEENVGVKAIVKAAAMTKLVEEADMIFAVIADGINNYCTEDTLDCCRLTSPEMTSIESFDFDIFDKSNVRFASGFPKMIESEEIMIHLLVEIQRQSVTSVCESRSKRQSDSVYVPPVFLQKTLILSFNRIQRELGLNISLILPDVKELSTSKTSQKPTTLQKVYIATGVICAGILMGFIIAIFFVCFYRRKGNSSSQYATGASIDTFGGPIQREINVTNPQKCKSTISSQTFGLQRGGEVP